MANAYHSLKLFRLLIGDFSQIGFGALIGFDSSAISLIESGYRSGARVRASIKALLYPFASDADVDGLVSGTLNVADVHRLAEAYARVKSPGAVGSPGGLNHGTESADVGGPSPVRSAAEPAGDRAEGRNGTGAGEPGGARASA